MPVFYYHHVDKNKFEKQLSYLNKNKYSTFDIADLEQLPRGGNRQQAVMLTFDDGYSDLYETAYPLLKKYKLKAVAFISPLWVDSPGYITWKQAVDMENSGVIDIQSHSYSHENIAVSAKVIDFYNPRISSDDWKEIPVSAESDRHIPNSQHEFKWGTPIYEYDSGLTDSKRVINKPCLHDACLKLVEGQGGLSFFDKGNWKKLLFKFVRQQQKKGIEPEIRESDAEQIGRIRRELDLSKKEIEKQLGKQVTAFACPRHEVGTLLKSQLEKSDYKWIFGGLIPLKTSEKREYKFDFINRVNGDFLTVLPGEGRDNFFKIMAEKIHK